MVSMFGKPKLVGDGGVLFEVGDLVEVHLKEGATSIPDEKRAVIAGIIPKTDTVYFVDGTSVPISDLAWLKLILKGE